MDNPFGHGSHVAGAAAVLVSDGVLIGDNTDSQGVLINGDQTDYMQP